MWGRLGAVVLFGLASLFTWGNELPSPKIEIELPHIILTQIKTSISVVSNPSDSIKSVTLGIGNNQFQVYLTDGLGTFEHTFTQKEVILSPLLEQSVPVRPIPLWLSIIPPLIAIIMALFFREVITSLFIGILVGTSIIYMYHSGSFFEGFIGGLLAIIDTYIIESLIDKGHISIIVFSMMIGAMVNVITKNGGMKGVVNLLTRYARSPRSGQFITWLLGVAIFFDDYANTLVVGNTMRPVTDKLRISRQKLAYLVDSTAAPVAAIAFVTTWIGAELSYIESGISTLGLNLSPYMVFLNSLAYSFYPIFTLVFMLILIYRKSDYGPMLKFEREARLNGNPEDALKAGSVNYKNAMELDEGIKARWYNAVIPVAIVVFGTFAGLLYTGYNAELIAGAETTIVKKLSLIIGNSDSYKALLWSSLLATIVAVVMSVLQRILSLQAAVESIVEGFRTMLTAIIILVLAWSIALVTQHMHTADFISKIIIETSLSPVYVPLITFVLAALVAFSTGSSWGTMAILYPLILPASWLITQEFNYEHAQALNIFYNVVASVLAGSVMGDHCSPISDTTILSSLASSCPHEEHVYTQMPYALTVGAVAAFVGVLPAALGVPGYITFPAGIIVLILVVKYFGKPTEIQ